MGCSVLLVHWPAERSAGTLPDGAAASLAARVALRRLAGLDGSGTVLVFAESAADAAAFARWGALLLAAPPAPATLQAHLGRSPECERVLLAVPPERAHALEAAARAAGRTVEHWEFPDATEHCASPGVREWPVAVLVDAGALCSALQRHESEYSPSEALTRILGLAELAGPVVSARVYSGEGCHEVSGSTFSPCHLPAAASFAPGEDRLRQELHQWLRAERPVPRTLILVTEDARLAGFQGPGGAERFRVVCCLCGAASSGGNGMRRVAPQATVLSLWDILPTPAAVSTVAAAHTAAPPTALSPAPPAAIRAAEAPVTAGNAVGDFTRVAYHLETLRRASGQEAVAPGELLAHLAGRRDGGFADADAAALVRDAEAAGLLLRRPIPSVDTEGGRGEAAPAPEEAMGLYPNPEHPQAVAAQEVPARCLRLLHQMLKRMPWVSFKLLRTVLAREQWLGGPPLGLPPGQVDEWLNFLIHDGAIRMSKERNLLAPEHPVTALRLNPAHPLAAATARESEWLMQLARHRALLSVAHYQARHHRPWMSMGALRRAMEALGREEIQEILHGLQTAGALLTETYPNPHRAHPTTGCRLAGDHPLVRQTLACRDELLAALTEEGDAWLPLSEAEARAAAVLNDDCGAPPRAWLYLLQVEGLVEVDPPLALSATHCKQASCRPVPGAAVARALPHRRE